MFWPSTQPSCLIDIQNGFVETDFARSCGLGTGPMPRIPTRAIFSDFCASAANGTARIALALVAMNARRSISRRSLDEFVGSDQKRRPDREPQYLGGLEVDH